MLDKGNWLWIMMFLRRSGLLIVRVLVMLGVSLTLAAGLAGETAAFAAPTSSTGTVKESNLNLKIGYWENDSSINDVVANNNDIYAISDDNLYILDVTSPSNPTQIGTYNLGGSEIVLSGNYAIIANSDTVYILDVSNPNNIVEEGRYDWYPFKAITVQENVVYGLGIQKGSWSTSPYLIILDISNPKKPTEISSLYVGSGAQFANADDLDVRGDYVYIVDHYDMGLTKVDISDLQSPVFSGTALLEIFRDDSYILYIEGDYSYIFEGHSFDNEENSVAIIDISDPANIRRIGSFTVSDQTIDIMSKGNYVYTISKNNVTNSGSCSIVNVADPVNPIEVAYDDSLSGLNKLSRNENTFFIATDSGVYIYNLYDSLTLTEYSATSIVEIGINPNHEESAGLFVGLTDIRDAEGDVVPEAKLADYEIELVYDQTQTTVLEVIDQANLGEITMDDALINTIKLSVADVVDQETGTANYEQLFFVPIALTGASNTTTEVSIKFTSLNDLELNPIKIPDITLTFQRGKILNEPIILNEPNIETPSIADAVAGLQYLAKLVDSGPDTGQINVINMASILPPQAEATGIKPSVKDVIALMQYLVGLRDGTFQLVSGS